MENSSLRKTGTYEKQVDMTSKQTYNEFADTASATIEVMSRTAVRSCLIRLSSLMGALCS